jgi:hypothetical protein
MSSLGLQLSFGLRVTVASCVAVSIGGAVQVSMKYAAMLSLEMLMKNIVNLLSGWCGAALLWRPVGKLPHSRVSAE